MFKRNLILFTILYIFSIYTLPALAQVSKLDKYPKLKPGQWLPEDKNELGLEICIEQKNKNALKKRSD